jgi:hypothetical protein
MTKRSKEQPAKSQAVTPAPSEAVLHPPAKQPTLLAASILLFALWFIFLFVTAIFG